MADVIQPKGWPRPRGFSNGMLAAGRVLAVGGQIGGSPPGKDLPRSFAVQFAQALDNVIAVVTAAGGKPTDLVSLTIYVTDQRQYLAATKDIGAAWRERLGAHYPAMALVGVASLIEPQAMVEIQGLAVLPVLPP